MTDNKPRYSIFTRINLGVGLLLVSLAPTLFYWSRINSRLMAGSDWWLLVFEIAVIQALFWLAVTRCSSDAMSYWNGLTNIAACVRTGWIYTDVFIAVLAIPIAILCSIIFALTSQPAALFHKMVYLFYRYRMVQ